MPPFGRKKEKDEKKIKLSKKNWKNGLRIYRYLIPYRFTFSIGLVFLFLSSLASLIFPKYLGKLVQQATEKSTDFENINNIALILLGLFALQAVFSYFRVVLFINVTEKSLADLRKDFFNHVVKLPMHFFNTNRVGELSSRLSSDIALLRETLTTTSAEILRQVIVLLIGTAMLFMASARLALFMLAILPIIVLLAVFFGKKLRKYSKMVQGKIADSQTIVDEVFQAIQNVKAFSNELFEVKRFSIQVNEIKDLSIKGGKLRAAFISFVVFGVFGSIVAVVWYGVHMIQSGSLTIGGLTEFLFLTVFIAASLGSLGDLYTQFQKAVGASDKLMEILDETQENLEDENGQIKKLNGAISLKNLKFAYPSRPEMDVLKGIDLEIKPGEQIAIVGGSGAGKSTLAAILYQFYQLNAGELLFDGVNAKELQLANIRNQMAIVPQELVLFGGTIKENIAYGKPEASMEEIEEAAKKAFAHEFIDSFPEGYETIVGDRGVQLSGGQRQRVAIARAILKNPKILILDEATSALDSESEEYVQKALEVLMKERTSIVIAHRLSTVRKADKIVVMKDGKVIEEGNHEALMEIQEGFYRNMKTLQL
ncbi:MAG: ABC transporter transmembrane domain-containing protein [Flavobacteriales bacterium]|jgi:ABC-type multidrug transport system fused ATPase/permease subunit|nr:ABC transporter transmembrane domain-containing protein [Flavobacteriales bacterium]